MDFEFPLGEAPEYFERMVEIEEPGWSDVVHQWQRVFSVSGIVFKGKGFYTTDRRKYVDVDTRYVEPDV